jgi:hypothetical protein
MALGEMDIGAAARSAPPFGIRFAFGGSPERGTEAPEADRGKFAQKAGQIVEMVLRRGVGCACLPGCRTQRQAIYPLSIENILRRLEQGFAQGSMMVGPPGFFLPKICRHGSRLAVSAAGGFPGTALVISFHLIVSKGELPIVPKNY